MYLELFRGGRIGIKILLLLLVTANIHISSHSRSVSDALSIGRGLVTAATLCNEMGRHSI